MTTKGSTPLACIIFAATLAVYVPMLLDPRKEYLDYDDRLNFMRDPRTHALTGANVAWAFHDGEVLGVWEPCSLCLKMATATMWRLTGGGATGPAPPRVVAAVTAVLHALNAALVFALAQEAFPRPPPRVACAVSALTWALHPLRVEVVAWLSGQPYALAGFFALLALGAHLRALRRDDGEDDDDGASASPSLPQLPWRALCWAAAIASSLSKAAALPVPALLAWHHALRLCAPAHRRDSRRQGARDCAVPAQKHNAREQWVPTPPPLRLQAVVARLIRAHAPPLIAAAVIVVRATVATTREEVQGPALVGEERVVHAAVALTFYVAQVPLCLQLCMHCYAPPLSPPTPPIPSYSLTHFPSPRMRCAV